MGAFYSLIRSAAKQPATPQAGGGGTAGGAGSAIGDERIIIRASMVATSLRS